MISARYSVSCFSDAQYWFVLDIDNLMYFYKKLNTMEKFLKIAFIAAFAAIAGYNVYSVQGEKTISDLALNDVDALARGEIVDYSGYRLQTEGSCKVCRRDNTSTCNVHSQVPC